MPSVYSGQVKPARAASLLLLKLKWENPRVGTALPGDLSGPIQTDN